MEYKSCCLTGHRPSGFPWDYQDKKSEEYKNYISSLEKKIITLIEEYGCVHFISGMAIGADTDFAKLCLDLRDREYPHITVEGAIPCPNQEAKWTDADKKEYKKLLKRLDKVTTVSNTFTYSCYQKRNEYMIDNSDCIIAVWNGEQKGGTYNSICYAKRTKKLISYLHLN